MNQLEKYFRTWVPRRPLAKVKTQIFGQQPGESISFPIWGWLAPAAACLLLTLAAFNQRDSIAHSGLSRHSELIAAAMSNQNYSAYLPVSLQARQNRLANTFEWTNGGSFTSSMGSYLMSQGYELTTNHGKSQI